MSWSGMRGICDFSGFLPEGASAEDKLRVTERDRDIQSRQSAALYGELQTAICTLARLSKDHLPHCSTHDPVVGHEHIWCRRCGETIGDSPTPDYSKPRA